jgi:hypothetical protein
MKQMLLIIVYVLLVGCASTRIERFSTFDHSHEPWGSDTKKVLYDEGNVAIVAELKRIITKFYDGYRVDKEDWVISIINDNDEPECVTIIIVGDGFTVTNLKRNPVRAMPDALINVALLVQESRYRKLLDFEYIGISRASVKISEAGNCR